MKRGAKTLVLLAGGFAFCMTAGAVTENRFQSIIDRNVFRLSDPPPPPVVVPPEKPVNIKYTGFAQFGGQLRAMFMIPAANPKDQPQYLSLTEGQRQDGLEVIQIFPKSGEVRIKNGGTTMTLNFTDHGLKPMGAPMQAAAAAPTAPGRPTTSRGAPQVTPGAPAQAGEAPTPAVRTIPQRTLRLPSASGTTAAPQPQAGQATVDLQAPRTGRGMSSGRQSHSGQQQSAPPPLDPVEQRILMELDREIKEGQGIPMPPLPPMPYHEP